MTEAISIRVTPFGETSQIVHLLTPTLGGVSALAKGSHRPGVSFQGGVPFCVIGQAHIRRRRGELHLLQRFTVRDGLRGLRRSLDRFYGANYVVELLRLWAQPELPAAGLFGAAVTALRALAETSAEYIPTWLVWFEARAIAAAGQRPRLDRCAVCNGDVGTGARFSGPAGGLTHPHCIPSGPQIGLSPTALDTLRRLYTERLPVLAASPPPLRDALEVRRVHDLYVPYSLERRPRGLARLQRRPR